MATCHFLFDHALKKAETVRNSKYTIDDIQKEGNVSMLSKVRNLGVMSWGSNDTTDTQHI